MPLYYNQILCNFIVGMLNLFGSCLDNMIHHLEQQVKTSPLVDMKPVFQCLTLDIISKCAFGLECNTHQDPTGSQLYKMAKELGTDTRVADFKESFMLHFYTIIKGKLVNVLFLFFAFRI